MFLDLSDVGSWLIPLLAALGIIWLFYSGFKGNSEVVKNGKIGKKDSNKSSSSSTTTTTTTNKDA